ncbi:hypothetical protein CCMA1212_003158 [Trichoderma ghanense]|uniref:Uncharacterized protein n=1 Tax=Trichoderma ghanense TaxID=65468 RepID=A0ABY2HD42_9HYPO
MRTIKSLSTAQHSFLPSLFSLSSSDPLPDLRRRNHPDRPAVPSEAESRANERAAAKPWCNTTHKRSSASKANKARACKTSGRAPGDALCKTRFCWFFWGCLLQGLGAASWTRQEVGLVFVRLNRTWSALSC